MTVSWIVRPVQCYAKGFERDVVIVATAFRGVSIVEIWVILPHVRVVRVDGFASVVPVSKSGMPIGKCYVSTFVTTPMLGAPVTIGAISPCFHALRATALISYPWPIIGIAIFILTHQNRRGWVCNGC